MDSVVAAVSHTSEGDRLAMAVALRMWAICVAPHLLHTCAPKIPKASHRQYAHPTETNIQSLAEAMCVPDDARSERVQGYCPYFRLLLSFAGD